MNAFSDALMKSLAYSVALYQHASKRWEWAGVAQKKTALAGGSGRRA